MDLSFLLVRLAILFFFVCIFFVFPYANENRRRRLPVATGLLIALNVLVFCLIGLLNDEDAEAVFDALAYRPGQSPFYALLTFNFVQGGALHLAFNMWYLLLVGGQVEERMGSFLFVLFYLAGGLSAALGYWIFHQISGSNAGVVGASGCVYAVMGAYFILYPFQEFRFWYSVFFHWGTVKVATLFVVTYKVLGDVALGWIQLTPGRDSGVAHWAHLGGFVLGVAVALAAFGAEPFTGKRRLSREEKARQRLLRRAARRKLYMDASHTMPREEVEQALDDCTPEEAVRRGLFFHSGRLLEWGCEEMLLGNPRACLEPPVQLGMIEQLRVHGRDALAETASRNLLAAYPESREAVKVRLELARVIADRPDAREEAMQLLHEFLASQPALREQIEAERLLRCLTERPLYDWKTDEPL